MRKTLVFAILFILSSLSVLAVTITPSNPTDNDNLVCSVPGQNPSLLKFTWNNGATTNTIPASSTNPGETWTCYVSVPPTRYTGEISLGSASVTIVTLPPINNSVPDTTPPTWVEVPTDRTVQAGSSLNYDINATDNVAVSSYLVNDTRFSISNSGLLTNNIMLIQFRSYYLKISAKDAANNEVSALITVTVTGTPNLEGTIKDTNTGANISNANISFYTNSDCSLNDLSLTGSCTTMDLQPKSNPDAVTDSNGHYSVFLTPGTYHIVVQHSKQVEYAVIVMPVKRTVDVEMNENLDAKDYNFEGHIIYEGQYRDGNKYVVGDNLTFIMFGLTHPSKPSVTVTYTVERHVGGVDNGANGPLLLNGSFSVPSQTLYVPGDGTKVSRVFSFIVPPSLSMPGRYDIHVLVNETGLEKWHKIGNFFIAGAENSTTPLNATTREPPVLYFRSLPAGSFYLFNNSMNMGQYVNQTFNSTLQVKIPAQNGTIPGILSASESDGSSAPVKCIFNSTGDEITINAPGASISLNGQTKQDVFKINVTNARLYYCYFVPEFRYVDSDHFNISISAKERYYGAVSQLRTINATIWATEQMARDIYYDITQYTFVGARPSNKLTNFTGYYSGDHCSGLGGFCADNTLQNKTDTNPTYGDYAIEVDQFSTLMGFEYRSSRDGVDFGNLVYPEGSPRPCANDVDVSLLGVTNCERDALNARWKSAPLPPSQNYILVTDPMIVKDLAKAIKSFATWIVINNSVTTP